jgi:hypothetical protein
VNSEVIGLYTRKMVKPREAGGGKDGKMRGNVLGSMYASRRWAVSLMSCPVRAYASIFGVALGMLMIGLQDGAEA